MRSASLRYAALNPGKGGGVPFGALLLNGQTITLNNDPITLVEEG